MEGSKTASSTKRQAKASDGKQGDAKHSALQNGTSERSKDVDKEARKEWMYEDKVGECMHACRSAMKSKTCFTCSTCCNIVVAPLGFY